MQLYNVCIAQFNNEIMWWNFYAIIKLQVVHSDYMYMWVLANLRLAFTAIDQICGPVTAVCTRILRLSLVEHPLVLALEGKTIRLGKSWL